MALDGPAKVRPRVAIVGGGLAGLAAAVRLAEADFAITLYEARRQLGGRAASFQDVQSDTLVDHCQHVSMGCCTNLADFCRRIGSSDLLRRDKVLHFLDSAGRRYDMQASSWLPAPLHLAPSFWRLEYLGVRDRLAIGRAVWKMMRLDNLAAADEVSIADWLKAQKQPARAITHFWAVILVSALGESLERASLSAARKVIVDGFVSSCDAYQIEVPQVPLGEFYGQRLCEYLGTRGVDLRLGHSVTQVNLDAAERPRIVLPAGVNEPFDFVITALPWRQTAGLFDSAIGARLPWLASLAHFQSAPISAVHFWFDRAITELPHAAIVGRLSQWIFSRPRTGQGSELPDQNSSRHYYQVVISASHDLAGRDKADVIDEVRQDLAAVFPLARQANLLTARLITEKEAVFSVRCGLERQRPAQQTHLPGLLVAGDWTATGWPSTMEGAVRSGYLAAEGVLRASGTDRRLLVADLPRSWLTRLLIRGA